LRHPELWETYLEEKSIILVLGRLLEVDSSAVDVGAHIGSFVSLLYRFAPEGSHVAFEPSREKSQWLRRNFPGVVVHELAVGDVAGCGIFEENIENPGFSRLRDEGSDPITNAGYDVTVCRLDDVLGHLDRMDLLKLDIEGHELRALKGGMNIIRRLKPAIVFECGTLDELEKSGVDRREIFEFITVTLGYRIFSFSDFLYGRGEMDYDEFRRCGIYPFRAFNFLALNNGQDRS